MKQEDKADQEKTLEELQQEMDEALAHTNKAEQAAFDADEIFMKAYDAYHKRRSLLGLPRLDK